MVRPRIVRAHTSGLAGVLNHTFSATSGVQYTLSFWLNNSLRGSDETVDVVLGTATRTILVPSSMPLTQFSLNFTATSTGISNFAFHNLGGDNVGAILDDVLLVDNVGGVPEPSTWLLLVSGLAGFIVFRKR